MVDNQKPEFKEKPKGVLVSMEEDSFSGYSYNIWFPYTRKYVNLINEGSFLAVKNFSSNTSNSVFSILEIVSAIPQHYALGSSAKDTERAFPGFVLEAAKSLKSDWEQDEPIEPTTIIKTQAIPTGLQIVFKDGNAIDPNADDSLPMMGEEAHLLTDVLTNTIVNCGLESESIATIIPGNLVQNPKVNIHISVEDLLRTHFGIFGFTNAGKSNLLSTLLSNLLIKNKVPIKIFLSDLMSEYPPLLIDVLDSIDDAYIIVFDEDSVLGGDATLEYLKAKEENKKDKEDAAIESILKTMLLPKELLDERNKYGEAIRRVLQSNKIKIYDVGKEITTNRIREEILPVIESGTLGNAKQPINSWLENNFPEGLNSIMISEQLKALIEDLKFYLNAKKFPMFFGLEDKSEQSTLGQGKTERNLPKNTVDLPTGALVVFGRMIEILNKFASKEKEELPKEIIFSFNDFIKISSEKENPSLLIFQSNNDDQLRMSSSLILNGIFNYRRKRGIIDPLILSVYDEADEFMPQSAKGSYAYSLGTIRNIARRGRKFGIGLAIATQRVAYLDTSTLAQPHTYFVSKMPRKYDRDTMASAFGVTEDMMRKTLKFTKGQWLLVSYDATGLVNVPLPIQFPNANDRIKEYLKKAK